MTTQSPNQRIRKTEWLWENLECEPRGARRGFFFRSIPAASLDYSWPECNQKSSPEFKDKYPDLTDDVQREHHANVTPMDHAFGKLMRTLDELKLADNTVVFFTSDNGPEGNGIKSPGRGSTGGLRGRKRAVCEGGIRVPGIVRWPGKAQPRSTGDVPVIGSDIFVTAVGIAGAKLPTDRVFDGGDLLAALECRAVERARPLYWRCVIAPGPLIRIAESNCALGCSFWRRRI